MFEIGFTELLLVGIVALLVLGPERLPVAARTLGRGLGQARRALNALKAQVEREIDMPALDAAPLQRLEQEIRQGIQLDTAPANDPTPVAHTKESA
ncbi:Sec-independent protein translocase protein TatB [Pseudomonas mosselii]|uniref:Sec-independent protein translocase protein TatB n=1 Tax=Pseudomonas mosselii TaxID=78327 RepID=UPI000D97FF71|nr:Sec-independent protein translocase protein TatB [Pseudomonas mosselii]PYC19463.1 twin-arginine translocase subunit TatB [Pseudomonas mosselii]